MQPENAPGVLRQDMDKLIALLLYVGLLTAEQQAATTQPAALQIDPLLLTQARAVWELAASQDNPIWPGWNSADTPLLFYLPGKQDVLVNHPSSPEGFVAYQGPNPWPGSHVTVRNGPTMIEWDGQNTAREINGVECLVVADTLSNRRQQIASLVGSDPGQIEFERLRTDPYEQMALIVHEAFHVFQRRQAPGRAVDERVVRLYPCLSVGNNVGVALEAEALAECVGAEDLEEARAAAIRFLAIRRDRRASLDPAVIAYEDGIEFSEGLAKYVELKLFEVLPSRDPPAELWLAQGFSGYGEAARRRDGRLEQMLKYMRGEVNVNNDRYGASPVRMRLYYSGMGVAAALDRFDPDWKRKILAEALSLTQLLEQAVKPSADELAAALPSPPPELLRAKQDLAEAGERDTQKLLAGISDGPETSVVIDYSELGTPQIGLAFTPFGVRAVDENRTVYTLVPVQAAIGSKDYSFALDSPRPVLEDRSQRLFKFKLTAALTAEEVQQRLKVDSAGPWLVAPLDFELPGARVKAKRAQVSVDGRTLRIRLLPAKPESPAKDL